MSEEKGKSWEYKGTTFRNCPKCKKGIPLAWSEHQACGWTSEAKQSSLPSAPNISWKEKEEPNLEKEYRDFQRKLFAQCVYDARLVVGDETDEKVMASEDSKVDAKVLSFNVMQLATEFFQKRCPPRVYWMSSKTGTIPKNYPGIGEDMVK